MRIGEGSVNGAAVQGVPSGNGNSQDGRIQIQKQIRNVREQMKKLNDNQELSPEEKADDTRTEKEKEDEKNDRTGQTDQDAGIQTAGNAAGAEAQSAAAYMPIDVRI